MDHNLLHLKNESFKELTHFWRDLPLGSNWDPNEWLWTQEIKTSQQGLIRLKNLTTEITQGISSRAIKAGDTKVKILRSADLHPFSLDLGTIMSIPQKVAERGGLRKSDLLMPRVGGAGRACYIKNEPFPLIASGELMVIRLKNPRWAPFLAAALTTEKTKEQIREMASVSVNFTLTRKMVRNILVPDPRHPRCEPILSDLMRVDKLISKSENILDLLRAQVDRHFNTAPTELPEMRAHWMKSRDLQNDWSWRSVYKNWLEKDSINALFPVTRLGDLSFLKISRGSAGRSHAEARRVRSDGFRPAWHLVLPEAIKCCIDKDRRPGLMANTEALLFPMVGALDSAPVFLSREVIETAGGEVAVPIHLGAITGFPYLRALALVLDHPFVRLQRRLSGAAGTVPHLLIETARNLFLPTIPEATWADCEAQIHEAHQKLLKAASLSRQAIETIEGWYK